MEPEVKGNIFNEWGENSCESRIVNLEELSYKNEGKIKTFSGKQKES